MAAFINKFYRTFAGISSASLCQVIEYVQRASQLRVNNYNNLLIFKASTSHDSMDAGGWVTQGAVTEAVARSTISLAANEE